MEKAALELLQQTANIPVVLAAAANITSEAPMVVLPVGYELKDLEKSMPFRKSYRGQFSTDSVVDYANYVKLFDQDGAKCFIDSESMSARTTFDLGNVAFPGHQEHKAKLALNKTAAYEAILEMNGRKVDQKGMSEFLEDWADFINCVGIDGQPLTANQAAAAVRKITIEAVRKLDSEVGDFSASMTALEKVEATSSMIMPSIVIFTCKPYPDLSEREFTCRLSILTGSEKPTMVLRILQLEALKESMTVEFKDLIVEGLKELECKTQTFIGNF